jgi:hypothetical protein
MAEELIFDFRFSIFDWALPRRMAKWRGSAQSFRGRGLTVCQIENRKSKILVRVAWKFSA